MTAVPTLESIEAALAAATPGPWAVELRADGWWVDPPNDPTGGDVDIIANAPAWLAYLLQRVKAAEAERDAAWVLHDYEIKSGRECCPCGTAADRANDALDRVKSLADGWQTLFCNALTPEGHTLCDAGVEVLKAIGTQA